MKRLLGLALLIAGCGDLGIPRYMQDAPRSEEDSRRVAGEIRKELGPDARVDLVEDLFFVATNDSSRSHERCKGTVTWVYRHLTKDFLGL